MSYDSGILEANGQQKDSHSFAKSVCVPALLESQNPEGGWGYRKDLQSRTEPTSWAILACEKIDEPETRRAAKRGRTWLKQSQRPDGLWVQHGGMEGGSWVTAAACLSLMDDAEFDEAVARGAAALCKFQPREKGIGWKIRNVFQRRRRVDQDFSVAGWSWIPGTVSWVIPTSLAVMALRKLPVELRPSEAGERIAMAEAMLFDRACPGGGWNCGNPMVYGVAGEALHEPTAWALLALRHLGMRPEVLRALEWMEATRDMTHGATSLALAKLCLEVHARSAENIVDLENRLESSWRETEFLGNVSSLALGVIALIPGEDRLRRDTREIRQ